LDKALKKFKKLADQHLFSEPASFEKAISQIKNSKTRKMMHTIYYGSAMDVLRKFFPKQGQMNTILGSFSASAIDGTHGLIQPSQWWDNRPVKGWSNYRTPLDNLYMCGASSHPGPGVTCIPGYNAANAVLKDMGIKVSTPNLTLDKPKKKLFFWRNSSGKV
jgi:hypothetical protein